MEIPLTTENRSLFLQKNLILSVWQVSKFASEFDLHSCLRSYIEMRK